MTVRLLEFTQIGCHACKAMEAIVASIRGCAGISFEEHGINTVLASKYGVRGTPTFVFVNDAGQVLDTFEGIQEEKTLRAAIERLSGVPCSSSSTIFGTAVRARSLVNLAKFAKAIESPKSPSAPAPAPAPAPAQAMPAPRVAPTPEPRVAPVPESKPFPTRTAAIVVGVVAVPLVILLLL